MFSGKSEELIRLLRRATIARQRVQVFKPALDNRYTESDVVSHSQWRLPCELVERADEVLARLDTTQLEASLERARGEIAQAEALAELYLIDHDRLAVLLESGTIGRSDYDLAKARLQEARARVATLQAAAR